MFSDSGASAPGDHRVWRQDGDRGVSCGHHRVDHPKHFGAHHQRRDARLRLHEDGPGQPPRRDAHLLQKRRHRSSKWSAHLHVQSRRPEEKYDHLCHRSAAGDVFQPYHAVFIMGSLRCVQGRVRQSLQKAERPALTGRGSIFVQDSSFPTRCFFASR